MFLCSFSRAIQCINVSPIFCSCVKYGGNSPYTDDSGLVLGQEKARIVRHRRQWTHSSTRDGGKSPCTDDSGLIIAPETAGIVTQTTVDSFLDKSSARVDYGQTSPPKTCPCGVHSAPQFPAR